MSNSGADQLQQKINQLSLIFQVSEDIVKAAKAADMHPAMLEVLLKIHNSQLEFDAQLKAMREGQLALAQLADKLVDGLTVYEGVINSFAEAQGIDLQQMITSEAAKGE